MKLSDMLDVDNLARHVAEGNVAEVRHPTEPVRLYNYTQRCQFSGAWDHESKSARGLIVDDDDSVLARPFPKFHNLYEHGPDSNAGQINLTPPLRVFDKLDGSLGIAYRRPSDGTIAWATRGSFTSDQAQWASKWWADHHSTVALDPACTYLAEIIYPENRIVIDYGDRSGLVLLAALSVETGEHVAPLDGEDNCGWPGELVTVFSTAEHVGQVDPNRRPDSEGYVVLSADMRTRVKLKADEYMRLHKIITGVSNITVWDMLRNGDPLDTLYDKVPDEFAEWARSTVTELESAYDSTLAEARKVYASAAPLLPDRKAFAAEVVKSPLRSIVFALADDKDAAGLVWKSVKPTDRVLPYSDQEAAA